MTCYSVQYLRKYKRFCNLCHIWHYGLELINFFFAKMKFISIYLIYISYILIITPYQISGKNAKCKFEINVSLGSRPDGYFFYFLGGSQDDLTIISSILDKQRSNMRQRAQNVTMWLTG